MSIPVLARRRVDSQEPEPQCYLATPFLTISFGHLTPEVEKTLTYDFFRFVSGTLDARSDLFAAGVTLYEAATGSNPFTQGTSDQMEKLKRAETMVLPPLRIPVSQGAEFRDLVEVMTQKRRDLRPSTAKEALFWMQEICANEGVQ